LAVILEKISNVLVQTGALKSHPQGGNYGMLFHDGLLKEMKEASFHPGREIDLVGGGPALDETVESVAFQPLSAEQWDQLQEVGVMRVEPLIFGRGTARLNIKSQRDLGALASRLFSWPQYYLTVTGFVQPGGDEAQALALAKSRADAAVQALVEHGTSPHRLRSVAKISSTADASAQSVKFVVGEP